MSSRISGNLGHSSQGFQMPSPRLNNYVDVVSGNPQSNSNINHEKMFGAIGGGNSGRMMSALSERNEESYGMPSMKRNNAAGSTHH